MQLLIDSRSEEAVSEAEGGVRFDSIEADTLRLIKASLSPKMVAPK
jgi:hypothetical protein